MTVIVSICEQATSGSTSDEVSLEFLQEQVSLRELIRRYVYETVHERNAKALNSSPTAPAQAGRPIRRRPQAQPTLDWEAEYALALASFAARGFLVLVDDHQVTGLDEEVQLRFGSRVTFFRLIPLAGG